MNQRPTLDPSTFEGLLAAAWVLQCQQEQEARNRQHAPDETLAEPPETHVEPRRGSECDTTNARLIATLSELSKAANTLQVSMRVRCAKCDNESDSRRRFCGMCGARLLEPRPTPQTEPPAPSQPAREQVPPVGGSSLLLLPGLADEPDSSFAYLLEDDVSTSHWGRVLVLVVLMACVAAAVWHWRRDLRDWAARFSQRPAATQAEQVSYSAAPISTLGSEAAGAVPNAQASREKPVAESAAQPAQLHRGANNAVQENTVAPAERFPRHGTAPAQVQTPVGGNLLNTQPASKKDAQSAIYQNKWTPPNHKIQGPGDGVWVKTATKPSPEIPFDSVAMATRQRGVSSTRPTAGTSMPGRNRDDPTRGTVRADTVAPAGVRKENPPAAFSAVDASQGASHYNSESQTTRDVQSTADRNNQTPTDHKIENVAAGSRENAATKPSVGRPFDSVAMAPRHYVPRPPQGSRTSNITAKSGRAGARPPSAGEPLLNESKSEPVQWAMSRYVPRPPWSSRGLRISEPSVPRPPARRVPRAP